MKRYLLVAVIGLLLAGCRGPTIDLKRPIEFYGATTDPTFRNSLAGQLRTSFLSGNRLRVLRNGVEIMPAMLAAIRSATNSINLETYIWSSGRMSDAFIEALLERAAAGVEIRCIADGFGSLSFSKADQERLQKAGVVLHLYNPPRPHRLQSVNYRDHRKLLIVDGRIAFTGGACIADAWLGNAEAEELWRDTHFQVEGPCVAQIQGIFGASWLKTEGEMLLGEKFYPTLEPVGDSLAQNFASGREDAGETARLVYLSAIAAAQKHLRLEHSYFVPDDWVLNALVEATRRGVEVEIITPGPLDSEVVRSASRALWPQLLQAGVKIYQYRPAMLHTKIMIVDDTFVTCGSVNLDERSFYINDEANMNVLDPVFAGRLIDDFERDKAQSKRIRLSDLKKQRWYHRAHDRFLTLFRGLL